MQVAPTAATTARAAMNAAIMAPSLPSNSNGMSFIARAAIATIAASTQLSDSEIHTLIGLIADIDKLTGADPALITKLMRNVLLLAQLMESKNPPGSYPQHSFQELADIYAADRKNAGGNSAGSIAAQIGTLATSVSATTSASTGNTPTPSTSLLA